MKINTENILERIRIEFEDSVGEVIEPNSRLREKVEVRAALVNAARPYATLRQLADMIGKADHSTILHLNKMHEVYTKDSTFYRFNYAMALKVVEASAEKYRMIPRHLIDSSINCVFTEIDTINKTIEGLKLRKENMEKIMEKNLHNSEA